MGRSSRASAARDARTLWDSAAPIWEHFQEQGLDFSRDRVHGPALLRAIGPVRGTRVLDVGCGQGRFTRRLARRGGRVTAIDWSERMLDLARDRERARPLGVRYLLQDARELAQNWPVGSFDLVVSCMALMDMPDLPRVLRGIAAVLTPKGRLVFSVSHPFNTAAMGWERPGAPRPGAMRIDRYFDRRVVRTRWRMARLRGPFDTLAWHRTIEDWFRLLGRTGFEVAGVSEPRASAPDARSNPLLSGTRRVPFFLVLSCRKVPGPRRSPERETTRKRR